jgi:hypothetical protein
MECSNWQKDKNAYIVFQCYKCNQYLYVKTTKKTKKCLRCGDTQTLSRRLNSRKNVIGIQNALNYLKKMQNELAINEIGSEPDLRATNDFQIPVTTTIDKVLFEQIKNNDEQDFTEAFKQLLSSLSGLYKEFPLYMIEILFDDYKIPLSQLNMLINTFKTNGKLIQLRDNYFSTNI